MTRGDQWQQIKFLSEPISTWCRKIDGNKRKTLCSYCKYNLSHKGKYLHRHAKSRSYLKQVAGVKFKHQVNCKDPVELNVMASAVLCSAMNCSVSLSPLTSDVFSGNTSQQSQPYFSSVFSKSWKGQAPSILQPPSCFIDVYICFYCSREFSSRKVLHTHQTVCDKHRSSNSPSLRQLPCATPIKQSIPFHYVKESKKNFMSSLGLHPKKSALGNERPRRNTECENIDLEEIIPQTPTITWSPKCLLSHLSRDGGENVSPKVQTVCRTLSWNSQKTNEKESNGQAVVKSRVTLSGTKSLYNIDLTSPLGLLTRKHVKGDPSLHILSDVESHCQTLGQKRDLTNFKLRDRPLRYPVTFRSKRLVSYIHQYKFTKREKREFMLKVNAGLDKKSRILLKRMKPCTVKLTHLTKADFKLWTASQNLLTVDLKPLTCEEIAFWTRTKAPSGPNSPAIFPSGLSFSSPNVSHVLGLRTRQDTAFLKKNRLSVSNYLSEEALAELTTNRRAVYQSLLSDTSCSENESERENLVTELSQTCTPLLRRTLSSCSNSPHKVSFLPDITNLKVEYDLSRLQEKTKAEHSSVGDVDLFGQPAGAQQFFHPSSSSSSNSGSSSAASPILKNSTRRVFYKSGNYHVCVREANEGTKILERITSPINGNVSCINSKTGENIPVKEQKNVFYSSSLDTLNYAFGAITSQKTVNKQVRSDGLVIKRSRTRIRNLHLDLKTKKKSKLPESAVKKTQLSCRDSNPSHLEESYIPGQSFSRKVICVDPNINSNNAASLPVIPLVILTRNWHTDNSGNKVENFEDQDRRYLFKVNSSKNKFHNKACLHRKHVNLSIMKTHSETQTVSLRKSMQRAVTCKRVCNCLLKS